MNRNVLFASCVPLLMLSLTGCLETRGSQKEQDEKQVVRKQLSTLQQSTADINSRFQDLEEDARRTNGRLEALELKTGQASGNTAKTVQAVDQKVSQNDAAYREEFTKLNSQIQALQLQLASMQDDQRRASSARAEAAQKSAAAEAAAAKNPFASAEERFEAKDWKEAAQLYVRYREQNPKGKQYAAATYKIGVCFEEMGLNEEARSFYEEVIAKFPKGKDSERANTRLKNLGKKKR